MRFVKSVAISLFFAALPSIFAAFPVSADDLQLGGVRFHADERTAIDSSSTKIVVDGRARIVPTQRVEEEIVRTVLRSDGESLLREPTQVAAVIEEALRLNKRGVAEAVLAFALLHPPLQNALIPQLDGLLFSDSALLRRLTNGLNFERLPQELWPPLLVAAAIEDEAYFRATLLREAVLLGARLDRYLINKCKSAIEVGNDEMFSSLVRASELMLGGDHALSQALGALRSRVTELEGASVENQFLILNALAGSALQKGPDAEVATALVRQWSTERIRLLLRSGDASSALMLTALWAPAELSPDQIGLLRNVLDAVGPDNPVLADARARAVLAAAGKQDHALHERYIELLDARAGLQIIKGDVAESERELAMLLTERPDPNSRNDALRVAQIVRYSQYQNLAEAHRLAQRAGLHIPLATRFKLFWLNFYGDWLIIVGIGLIPVLFLCLLYLGMNRRARESAVERDRERRQASRPVSQVGDVQKAQIFAATPGSGTHDPHMQEYLDCLKIFGLKPGSDLKAIKNAYRVAVKKSHPDLRGTTNEAASARFIELTKTYDRLIELNKIVRRS